MGQFFNLNVDNPSTYQDMKTSDIFKLRYIRIS